MTQLDDENNPHPIDNAGNGKQPLRFLTKAQVLSRTTLSYERLWRLCMAGEFPRGHCMDPCGKGKVVWFEHEVEKWMSERPVRKLMGQSDGVPPPRHLKSNIHPRRKRRYLTAEQLARIEAKSAAWDAEYAAQEKTEE